MVFYTGIQFIFGPFLTMSFSHEAKPFLTRTQEHVMVNEYDTNDVTMVVFLNYNRTAART